MAVGTASVDGSGQRVKLFHMKLGTFLLERTVPRTMCSITSGLAVVPCPCNLGMGVD
jgi:hypothetical protein